MQEVRYTEDEIKSLDWREHIRLRPGMYIGKLGDGASPDDGIYVLLKEVIDNCIDEYAMGFGRQIDVTLTEGELTVRDFGRGIPLGKVVDVVSKINTGAKYDSKAFKKSVGLNGVGTKAVNALSEYFVVKAYREGQCKTAEFQFGNLKKESKLEPTKEDNGTFIRFKPDNGLFRNFRYLPEYIEQQLWNYAYLNAGLKINFNGKTFWSKNGLLDLLEKKTNAEHIRYPIIHLKGEDVEIAMTHGDHYGEQTYSFVNGQNTTQGGTHLNAFREALVKVIRDHFKKQFDAKDIRESIIAAIAVRVEEPVFESQTKTRLGSERMAPDGPAIRTFMADFLGRELDNFLHKNPEVAKELLKRIQQSERERKEIADVKKIANERAKKANIHNKKLRDCRYHLNEKASDEQKLASTIFITEGDSASGSLTKARRVDSQAVFSLRGKPLNCYGLTKKIVYQNEEFNLLQHALNIEDSLDDLRYNRVVIATDADVDGSHIATLILTFVFRYMKEMVEQGYVYIAQPPLYLVKKGKEQEYAYNEEQRKMWVEKLGGGKDDSVTIQRYKGLGEMNADQLWETTMDPARRTLKQVTIESAAEADRIFSMLMGDDVAPRREFIESHAKYAKIDV